MRTQAFQQSTEIVLNSGLSITKIDNFFDLLPMQEQWNETLRRSGSDSPFLTFEWLSSWWNHLSGGSELFVLLVREQDQMIAIAPLMLVRKGLFRVLQFIGTGRSDYLDFIVTKRNQESLYLIFKYICDSRKYWDLICLQDFPADSPNFATMNLVMACLDMKSDEIVATVAPYVAINTTWNDYLSSKSRKFRNDIRRAGSKLEKFGQFQIIHEPVSTSEHLDVIRNIEKQSWKAEAGCCRLAESDASGFYLEFMEKFSKNNWLDLWLLKLNQEPIAYIINFVYNNKIYDYSTAYVSQYKHLFPGKALLVKSIEDAFNRKMSEYDLLKGDEPYKFDWTSHQRELYHVVAHRKSLRSVLTYLLLIKLRRTLQEYSLTHKLNLLRTEFANRLEMLTRRLSVMIGTKS